MKLLLTASLAACALGAAAQETVWGVLNPGATIGATLFFTNTELASPTLLGPLRLPGGTQVACLGLAQNPNLGLRASESGFISEVGGDTFLTRLFPAGGFYGGLCSDVDGSMLALTAAASLRMFRLTPGATEELGTVTLAGQPLTANDPDLAWTHAGLIVGSGDRLFLVDPVTLQATTVLSMGTTIHGVAAGPSRLITLTEGNGQRVLSIVFTSPHWRVVAAIPFGNGDNGDLATRPAVSFATISLDRPGWGGIDAAPVTIDVRTTSGFRVQRATIVPSGGSVTFPTTLRGGFTVWVKGDRWLAGTTPVAISDSGASASVTLLPGDIAGDNVVDVSDFLALAATYEALPVSPATADLTGDGQCDLQDFLLLAANYEQAGAP